jgi:hypothetical protein
LSSAKYAAIQAIETGRHPERVAPLDPKSTDTHPILLPNAKSPAELTSALALLALRRLEKGLHDFDPKVSFEAARVACVVASKVSELPTAPGSDVADPVARRAALVAALGTPAVIEIVIAVAGTDGPLRTALEAAGWRGPDAVPR